MRIILYGSSSSSNIRSSSRSISNGSSVSRVIRSSGGYSRNRGGGDSGGDSGCGSLALLLLVGNSSGFGLGFPYLSEVNSDSPSGEGIGFGTASVFFKGRPESSD